MKTLKQILFPILTLITLILMVVSPYLTEKYGVVGYPFAVLFFLVSLISIWRVVIKVGAEACKQLLIWWGGFYVLFILMGIIVATAFGGEFMAMFLMFGLGVAILVFGVWSIVLLFVYSIEVSKLKKIKYKKTSFDRNFPVVALTILAMCVGVLFLPSLVTTPTEARMNSFDAQSKEQAALLNSLLGEESMGVEAKAVINGDWFTANNTYAFIAMPAEGTLGETEGQLYAQLKNAGFEREGNAYGPYYEPSPYTNKFSTVRVRYARGDTLVVVSYTFKDTQNCPVKSCENTPENTSDTEIVPLETFQDVEVDGVRAKLEKLKIDRAEYLKYWSGYGVQ